MRGFLISPYSFSSTPVESRKFNYPQANTSINVAFPEELLIAAREEKETFSRQVMIYPLGHLYQEGKISAGIGAQVLGCDKYTFYALLSDNGFSIIDYTEEEWELEVQTSREIAAKIQAK